MGSSLEAVDEVDVIYLDFSKASESAPRGRLLHKLSLLGIQGSLHAWFTDYLSSTSQGVLIDGVFSPWVPLISGIPQGSILRPLLFLLYIINDLPNVTSPSTCIALFADDAKCYRVVRNAEDCSPLQHDLSSVYDWCKDRSLSNNTNKREVLRISRKRCSLLNLSTVNPYTMDWPSTRLSSLNKRFRGDC